nr:TetR/AcrR family transcriptional regulator [Xylanimonas cellulosilytica]
MIATTGPCRSVRERKKRERRRALIDAAQALVRERGLDGVTVEEISAAAGVSTRTFFNYFASKDDAVLGVHDIVLAPETERVFVSGGPTGRLLDDLQVLVAGYLATGGPSLEQFRRATELLASEPRLAQRTFAWHEGHRSGLVALLAARREVCPTVVDDETAAMAVALLHRSAASAWERSGFDGDAVEHLPTAVAALRALVHDGEPPLG